MWTFGVQNGGKITKNLSKRRSENENGDFSAIVFPCTREHDFLGPETSEIEHQYQKTVTERRRKPKRVSGVHFHDVGTVLGLEKDPKIIKKRSENDTEKQTRKKGVKKSIISKKNSPDRLVRQ